MAKKIYDCVRREYVADQPEERVRQSLLRWMINEGGFPLELLAVEKAFKTLHCLYGVEGIPDRRADIICFTGCQGGDLQPLLLVECKAVKITKSVLQQVEGYNFFLKSKYVAVVNQDEIMTGWLDIDGYTYIDFLPTYRELMNYSDNV